MRFELQFLVAAYIIQNIRQMATRGKEKKKKREKVDVPQAPSSDGRPAANHVFISGI